MQKARRHSSEDELRPLVSIRFQVLLTPLVGVLFIFQSPYFFTIGRQVVFSLGGWSPLFHAEFHELHATLVHLDCPCRALQDFHLLWFGIRDRFMRYSDSHIGVRNPTPKRGLGFSDFARRYSRNRGFFLFLQLLRCFSSLGSLPCPMHSDMTNGRSHWVSPFGHLRIEAWLPAPRSISQVPTSFIAS